MSPIDRVAFTIFGKEIYWYAILITVALVLGVVLACRRGKKQGIDIDSMLDLTLLIVPLAVIFARIYYVAFEWRLFAQDPVRALYIWEGGLAIYGAVIGGLIGVWIFARRKKLPILKLFDILVPSLVLGQAIGRWGNFINQEAFGALVTNPGLQFFPYAVFIEASGTWHQAAFFYESAWCLLIFVFLTLYLKKDRPHGNAFLWYLLLYGLERSLVEGLRTDSLWLGDVRISQVLSILMTVGAAALLICRALRRRADARADAPPPILIEPDEAAEEAADQSEPPADEEPAPQEESPQEPVPGDEEPAATDAPADEEPADGAQ